MRGNGGWSETLETRFVVHWTSNSSADFIVPTGGARCAKVRFVVGGSQEAESFSRDPTIATANYVVWQVDDRDAGQVRAFSEAERSAGKALFMPVRSREGLVSFLCALASSASSSSTAATTTDETAEAPNDETLVARCLTAITRGTAGQISHYEAEMLLGQNGSMSSVVKNPPPVLRRLLLGSSS